MCKLKSGYLEMFSLAYAEQSNLINCHKLHRLPGKVYCQVILKLFIPAWFPKLSIDKTIQSWDG